MREVCGHGRHICPDCDAGLPLPSLEETCDREGDVIERAIALCRSRNVEDFTAGLLRLQTAVDLLEELFAEPQREGG